MLLAVIGFAAAAMVGSTPGCEVDTAALLKLTPEKFDQDMQGGWRPLGDKPQCYGAAADLLAAYRHAHWGSLKPGELQINYAHEGQMRAANGDYGRAVGLILSQVGEDGADGFADYALGTAAFLKRDLPALKSARERLSRAREPDGFQKARAKFKTAYNRDLVWPPNLDVLDGLIACFDKPYAQAYGGACRPKAANAQAAGTTPSSK